MFATTSGDATCSPYCQAGSYRHPPAAAQRASIQFAASTRALTRLKGARLPSCSRHALQASAVEQSETVASDGPGGDAQQHTHSNGTVPSSHATSSQPSNGPPKGEVSSSDPAAASGAPSVWPQRGAAVKVEGMVKHFRTRGGLYKAVDGVDLTIHKNKLVALLGPSGSGKTTLLRMIAGLEEPTAGRILINGKDASTMSVAQRNVGFTFQSYALFKHMTVAQNIGFGPRVRKLDIDIDARVKELLELVELPGLGDRYPPQLSGGQRQRIALARALASDPQILLLDEPFGALDPLVRVSLRRSLRAIVERLGLTTVMVTHDQEEAFDIADRVVIFNKGRIEQEGETADVIRRPATPFVMNFVGEVNAVPASCQLTKRMGFETRHPAVMFRPEKVQVLTDIPPGDRRVCPAVITDKKHIGWVVKYLLQCDDGVKLEMHVLREDDDRLYSDLDTLQRVFLKVPPLDFMGYAPADIDQSPLDLV